jgi:NAD-dependent DNA ligase
MIEKLEEKIIKANEAYRLGKSIISDKEYDILIDELSEIDPDNKLLTKIGYQIIDESRKRKLPIPMFSMNKVKTLDEINDWVRLKGINTSQNVVITPKYDGLSLCVNELTGESWTRGNGEFGQKSDEHYKLIGNHLENLPEPWPKSGGFKYTFGEVMMPKKVFIDKYSSEFANPRNLVAGLLNSKEVTNALKDTLYIKYGGVLESEFKNIYTTKSQILTSLNDGQETKVPFKVYPIKDLTHDLLVELFKLWSNDFEIDGLIIEVDYLQTQEILGRETSSGNPSFARAYKSTEFEQVGETEIIDIDWQISKNGFLKPVARLNPIRLDGVTISNVTCNNARFVKDMGLGSGAVVKIVRSGMVIPKIIDVITPVEFVKPTIEGVEVDWNEAGIELITLTETEDQKLKKIVAFFEILEADNVSEGVITQLWESGYKTIKDILNLKKENLEKIDRFGKRKAEIVFNSIQKSVTGIQLSKLQHATGIFRGLGSKKLVLLEDFKTKPTVDQVMSIEGFAEVSAQSYIESYDTFFDFIKDLPVTIVEKVEAAKVGDDLVDMVVVYTGIRDKISEELIVSRGGKIGSGVSKNTTHIICKDTNSGSSKLEKAKSLGIKIMTLEDLNTLLKKSN